MTRCRSPTTPAPTPITRERGATLSITTNTRSIALLGRRGPSGGWVITRDDETIEMVSSNDRERTDLAVLLSWTWPTVGFRTVTVTARVQKPYRPLVALDAWVIER